jgi:hypothetical protein
MSVNYKEKLAKYNAKYEHMYNGLQPFLWPDYLVRHVVANYPYTLPIRQPQVILTQSAIDKINNNNNNNFRGNPLATVKDKIIDLIRKSKISMGFVSHKGEHNYTVFEFSEKKDAEDFGQYLRDYKMVDPTNNTLKVEYNGEYHYVSLDVPEMLSLITILIDRAVTLSDVQKLTNSHGSYFRVSPSNTDTNMPALERPTNAQIIHFIDRKDEDTNTVIRQPLRYNMIWHRPRV